MITHPRSVEFGTFRSGDTAFMPRAAPPILLAVITLLATLVAYAPVIDGDFLFDGVSEIRENPAIRTLWPPTRPMFEGGRLPHRPLPYLSFAVNYALHGLDPRGFHLVNLGIHLVNGLLAAAVIMQVLRIGQPDQRPNGDGLSDAVACWAIVSLWLVHPLCTQAVSYVYQRMELMAATAILAALLCHLLGRDGSRLWAGLSLVASGLGMACKETAVVIPPLLILATWLVLQPAGHLSIAERWRQLPALLWRHRWYWLFHFSLWGVVAAIVLGQRGRFGELAAPRWSALEYLINQPRALGRYLSLAVWPAGQCLDSNWQGLTLPQQWPILMPGGVAVIAIVAGFLACIRTAPKTAFALGSFLLLLAPTSSFLPVTDLCMEHRMYLPLLPLLAVAVAVASAVAGRWLIQPGDPPLHRPAAVVIGGVAAVGIVAALAAVTWSRNHVYTSGIAMWKDVVAKQPTSGRAAINLATAYLDAGRETDAIGACREALDTIPGLSALDRSRLHLVCGRALTAQGATQAAVWQFDESLRLDPRNIDAQLERGHCLLPVDPDAARQAFLEILTERPDHAAALNNLAGLLAAQDSEAALRLLRQAIGSEPENLEYRLNAANLLKGLGRFAEAERMLRSAATLEETTERQGRLRQAVP
jgi:protein O-mannosyl-transferase